MLALRRLLTGDGLALIHFFGTQRSWPDPRDGEVLWVRKHIFPGFVAPSLKQVAAATDGLLVYEDLHNIGPNYDPTLMAWASNFDRAWASLRPRYGERFYRLWRYYLLCAAGAFRSRKYQVWQIVLSPHGVPSGYRPVRTLASADDDDAPPSVVPTARAAARSTT
jgi:cyclopropane-fatty-acyl-phospholipid synthase